MNMRCSWGGYNRKERYSERGIAVCRRWRTSFENFYADMGPRPSPGHSLDRIDNDGPYSPENCRWATDDQQARNRSITRWIEFEGRVMCLKDWAAEKGVNYTTVAARLKNGDSIKRALRPAGPQGRRKKGES
jgi:hypothetical protein